MKACVEFDNQHSFPLDARIPDTIKHKIWANEFIDLNQLIKPSTHDSFNITMSSDAGVPSLCLLPKINRSIATTDQWNSAFTIFMSIYLTKFPFQAHDILKYSRTINDLKKKGGHFLTYDENVRYLRQRSPSSWGTFHTELYVAAMTNVALPSQHVARNISRGFCFTHHAGRFCDGCSHSHRCPYCGDAHAAISCTRNNQSQPHSSRPQSTNTGQPFRSQHYRPRMSFRNFKTRPSNAVPRYGGYPRQQYGFSPATRHTYKSTTAENRP